MADFNPHEEKSVKENEDQIKRRLMREKEDLKWVLSTQQGRRVLWKLLSFCGVFKISFTGNSTTFFNEGQRNVGLKLFNEVLGADEQAYLKMRNEANEVTK